VRILALTAFLALAALTAPGAARAQAASEDPARVAGVWDGALETSDGRQRLTLNLGYAGGRLTGALDSIDQGVSGAPLEVDLTQSRLRLTQPERDAEFQGMVSADVEAVVGIWSQAGRSHPLTFRRRPGASPSVARP
jgi:hypothetical protein